MDIILMDPPYCTVTTRAASLTQFMPLTSCDKSGQVSADKDGSHIVPAVGTTDGSYEWGILSVAAILMAYRPEDLSGVPPSLSSNGNVSPCINLIYC